MPHETLLDLLRKGQCVVQDESSMLVSHVVDPAAGDMVIDACAAPGGKATHIALLGGTGCRLIAVDKNERRMEAMRKTVSRLGISNIETIVGDSTRLQDLLSEKAAIIIVDAPCSGLGTLRRNPELKWRRTPEDLDELKRLQISLLCGCSDNLAPGGALVYSVCTFTAEETTGVIEEFLRDRRDFKPADATPYLPEALRDSADGDGFIQIMPHKHGMEGMFIARLERN
jgi:16S rRNA (cytosine967-C5)-methyltransferase